MRHLRAIPDSVAAGRAGKSVVNSFYHQSFLIDHFCILQVPKHQILASTITFFAFIG
jgi:hypothetical protein